MPPSLACRRGSSTCPCSADITFWMPCQISSSLLMIGRSFSTELISFLIVAPIFSVHAATCSTTCATTTGVPRPRVNTSSSAYWMKSPTACVTMSRTSARTTPVMTPTTLTTVLMAFEQVAIVESASTLPWTCLR